MKIYVDWKDEVAFVRFIDFLDWKDDIDLVRFNMKSCDYFSLKYYIITEYASQNATLYAVLIH